MKKNRIYYFIISLLLVCFFGIDSIKAASVSISSGSNNVVVGNNINVSITVSSDAEAWDFSVGYDTSKLRVVSSNLEAGMRSASASSLHSRSYSITFKAIASGSASVYVSDAALYDTNSSSLGVSKGSKTFTLRTQAEIEASYSKNNYLSSLSVEGKELSPGFDKDTLEYSVELEPETPSININASVADSTASVSGVGTREVSEGDNRLEIIVTAQNGSNRTYIINAKVKEYNPIEVSVDNSTYNVVRKKALLEMPSNYEETTVVINDEEVPAFKGNVTGYILVGLKDSDGNTNLYIYDEKEKSYTLYKEYSFNKVILYPMELNEDEIPNGYSKVKVSYNDQDIVAYKLDKNSKYALIYGMNVETGKTNLYMYDSVEDTLQIYNTEEIEFLKSENDKYLKLLVAVLVVVFILIISLVIAISKLMRYKELKKIINPKEKKKEDEITVKEVKFKRKKKVSKKEKKKEEAEMADLDAKK